jgi:hypothetical protein
VSTYYPPVRGRPRTIYDGLTQQELSEKINEVTFTDKEREEFTDILSKNGLDAPKEGNEEKAREVFTDYLLARDVLLREIDDVSTEDAEALIFKPTGLTRKDEDFLVNMEISGYGSIYDDPEVEINTASKEKEKLIQTPDAKKRLSMAETPMAETPVNKFKSPLLNKHEERRLSSANSPFNSNEEETPKSAGRPSGSLGVVNRIKNDAFRTDEEKIQHFMQRKRINQFKKKPQMSYKDMRNKDNKERFTIDKFLD